MSWRGLRRPRPMERLASDWGVGVVDALDELYGRTVGVEVRGTSNNPWDYFYGNFGFFNQNLYVQGKPVIKDGDPINIYDIFTPAQQKITQSIDNALITQYTRESRDVLTKVLIDEYGRVGVAIAEPLDEYGRVLISIGGSKALVSVGVNTHYKASILLLSGTVSASGSTSNFDVSSFESCTGAVNVTAVSGTTPSLDVFIEGLEEATGAYITLASKTGINAVGVYPLDIPRLDVRYVRLRYEVSGTTPSFTLSVGLTCKA